MYFPTKQLQYRHLNFSSSFSAVTDCKVQFSGKKHFILTAHLHIVYMENEQLKTFYVLVTHIFPVSLFQNYPTSQSINEQI